MKAPTVLKMLNQPIQPWSEFLFLRAIGVLYVLYYVYHCLLLRLCVCVLFACLVVISDSSAVLQTEEAPLTLQARPVSRLSPWTLISSPTPSWRCQLRFQ